MEEILRELRKGDVTSQILWDLIEEHKPKAARMKRLYKAYKQKELPIQKRVLPDSTKVNNKLPNDYRGDIVNQINGYLFGQPLTYQIDKQKYDEATYDRFKDTWDDYYIRNHVEDLDAETGKIAGICGYAARLNYIHDGVERTMNVMPWECIFIEDGSIEEAQYAMRYYPVVIRDHDKSRDAIKVEWYDGVNVTFYLEAEDGKFYLDRDEPKNPAPHLYDYNPLIKFQNNAEEQGDFEKVEDLIDAYDRLLSDVQNEIEEFRLAYLLFFGGAPTPDQIRQFRQTGAVEVPDGGDVRFLTKDMIDTAVENHKRTLNDNIYKFSGTVDMASDSFSGSSTSGESRKWRLLSLENKVSIKERKFSKALRQQFKVICSAWAKRGINLDYLDIYWDFKRNTPIELTMEAEVVSKLRGHISDQTLYGLLSFIDNPEWEIEMLKQERDAYNVDLDNVELHEGDQ